MSNKRGPYFQYETDKNQKIKIPRQTLWNQKQRLNKQQLYFVPETSRHVNNVVNECMETSESENNTEFEHEEVTFNGIEHSENDDEWFYDSQFDIDDLVPLPNNPNCSKADAMSIIYAFSVRHNLNWTCLEDLVHLINTLFGAHILPASKYMFKKKFGEKDVIKRTMHFICHSCEKYLGTEEVLKSESVHNCSNCGTEICMDTKYKKNHFITIPIKRQIITILERNANNINLNAVNSTDIMQDVQDSLTYQRLKSSVNDGQFISLIVSTDGAALFTSTKEKSFWPIQFYINEIDLKHRFKRDNMICAAFSFGKQPNMAIFFKEFIQEINQINADGGVTFRMKDGKVCKVKVLPFVITADAPAKSDILNRVHHTGRGGCPYCEHNGTVLPGKKQVLYCTRDNTVLRNNDQTRADMIEAHRTEKRVNGYHGLSSLLALECEFDIIQQIALDQMHCIHLGVVKRLMNLFLHDKYRGKE